MSSDLIEYLIRPDHTVVEIHGGWEAFAEENDAAGLAAAKVVGRALDDFVADDETRLVYEALIERVLETAEPIRFTYRCDGPACRRHMAMEMDLVSPELVRFRSRVMREEPRPAQPLLDPSARRGEEILRMCSWCKRVERDGEWMEVEDYVEASGVMELESLPRVSHGICPVCEAEMERLASSPAA